MEKFVSTCVDSILSQSFTDFELIVVDDCSTDRSAEIVRSFEDPRIRLVRNIKNLRCDLTRNIGLTFARGDFIYFMDSDDAILQNTIETLVTAIEESQAEVVIMNSNYEISGENFTAHTAIKAQKKYIGNPKPRLLSDDLFKRIQAEYVWYQTICTPWIKIQRRDFLIDNQILFPNTRRGGDLLFHLAELCLAKKIQVIDFCGYVRHFHQNQISKTPTKNLLKLNIQNLKPVFQYIHEIFASKNLISDLPKNLRDGLEIDLMLDYFKRDVHDRIGHDFSQTQITEIFRETILQSRSFDSEFVVSLLNILTRYMSFQNQRNA